MHKNLKALIFTLFFFLAAVFIILYFQAPANKFCFPDIGTQDVPNEMISLNNKQTIGQTFVPNFDNLFKISIFISKQGVRPDAKLRFHLKEYESKEDIVLKDCSISDLKPSRNDFYQIPPDAKSDKGFFYHIYFAPLMNSKGKKLYFYFESINPTIENGVKFGIWKRRFYEALAEGNLIINGRPADNFLAFRTYNTWRGSAKDVFKEIFSRFSKDAPFMISYQFLVCLVLAGTLLAIRR